MLLCKANQKVVFEARTRNVLNARRSTGGLTQTEWGTERGEIDNWSSVCVLL